ncbi:hypothetical protein PUN28_017683 [Cardiocondyla obscurior]|uniref:Ribosomal protein L20 n=1 Tax=Cardiocondyla obscurior TaxID=286306 RepID=A0AAW2EMG8_9HYME
MFFVAQGFRIRLNETTAGKRIRDFSLERWLLKNSREFRIRYFVGRFTAARRSFVKAKYRSTESYLRSSRVANLVRRREGFFYSARAFHEHHLNYVYLLTARRNLIFRKENVLNKINFYMFSSYKRLAM